MGETVESIDSTKEAKDPICGMTTGSPEAFISFEHRGETFYFCSEHCLEKFKTDPDKYIRPESEYDETDASGTEDQRPAKVYTCPMHPEVIMCRQVCGGKLKLRLVGKRSALS